MRALTKTEWRTLLDEYRRLAIAQNAACLLAIGIASACGGSGLTAGHGAASLATR